MTPAQLKWIRSMCEYVLGDACVEYLETLRPQELRAATSAIPQLEADLARLAQLEKEVAKIQKDNAALKAALGDALYHLQTELSSCGFKEIRQNPLLNTKSRFVERTRKRWGL